jgi:5-methyltetrahydropteroyltriglutamate--homocysteine methyltransferase
MENQTNRPLDKLRVDQVGSLLRPEWLIQTYARHGLAEITDKELQEAQDRAVREVLARQESLGYGILTDGEYRRIQFQDSFGDSVQGLETDGPHTVQGFEQSVADVRPLARNDPTAGGSYVGRRALHRLRLVRNVPLEEYRFSSAATSRPVKVTMLAPSMAAQRFDEEGSRPHYDDAQDYLDHVAAIEREMIGQLVAAGCRYIQLDATNYTAYVDPILLDQMRAGGKDPATEMRKAIRADNSAIAGFPEVTFGIHLCRGNRRGGYHREGAYDAIAEELFGTLALPRFLLEYDSDRAGGFEPLRFVPRGKVAVLGLVTTKVGDLESADDLKRRIADASRFAPVEQLALSPQCGFSSGILGNFLSEDDQWRKLERITQVAAEVWK